MRGYKKFKTLSLISVLLVVLLIPSALWAVPWDPSATVTLFAPVRFDNLSATGVDATNQFIIEMSVAVEELGGGANKWWYQAYNYVDPDGDPLLSSTKKISRLFFNNLWPITEAGAVIDDGDRMPVVPVFLPPQLPFPGNSVEFDYFFDQINPGERSAWNYLVAERPYFTTNTDGETVYFSGLLTVIDSPTTAAGGVVAPGDSQISVNLATGEPVPEPATLLLLGSGIFGAGVLRRKFRKS